MAATIGFLAATSACMNTTEGLSPLSESLFTKLFTSLPLVKQSSTPLRRITFIMSVWSAIFRPSARAWYMLGSKAFFFSGLTIFITNTFCSILYLMLGSLDSITIAALTLYY